MYLLKNVQLLIKTAGLVSASPAFPIPYQEVSMDLSTGTAIGGALDLAFPRPTPIIDHRRAAAPANVTIRIANKNVEAISTAHFSDVAGPAPVSGNTNPGTIANGVTAAFAVPTGVCRPRKMSFAD